jgi:hypothetical protein
VERLADLLWRLNLPEDDNAREEPASLPYFTNQGGVRGGHLRKKMKGEFALPEAW